MSPRPGHDSEFLPLFDWPERREIDRLEAMRRELHQRILKLPKMAHSRIALEVRLRTLTEQQLMLENTLRQKANQ